MIVKYYVALRLINKKMNRIYIVLLIGIFSFTSCKQKAAPKIDMEFVVNRSIKVSGGEELKSSILSFDFRDKHYNAIRNNGIYQLERHFKDSVNVIKDVLTNSGFKRYVDNELLSLPDSTSSKYSNSVNSVHYFSVLPYGLNDAAVNKFYLGLINIGGKEYHKIKVTFDESGGGDDFEDVFVYWIDAINYKVNYLAYSFHVNGGGMRFREAYNERAINGIRFVDYNNYKPNNNDVSVSDLDKLFGADGLKMLSKIELKNIKVE